LFDIVYTLYYIMTMEISWDPEKKKKLMAERGIDLDEIKALIENENYYEILENEKRPGQYLIVLEYKSYVHAVPVKLEANKIFIKTCYPSRKANKKYKGEKE
jgi:uncharacterized DUF497 family protein